MDAVISFQRVQYDRFRYLPIIIIIKNLQLPLNLKQNISIRRMPVSMNRQIRPYLQCIKQMLGRYIRCFMKVVIHS